MQTPFTRIEGGSTQLPQPPAAAVPLTTYLRENDKRGEAEGKLEVARHAISGLLWHLNLIARQCPDELTRLRARCVVEAHRPGTYPHADSDYDELLSSIGLGTGRAA